MNSENVAVGIRPAITVHPSHGEEACIVWADGRPNPLQGIFYDADFWFVPASVRELSVAGEGVQLLSFPEPMRREVNLGFRLSGAEWVSAAIVDVSGRLVRRLAGGQVPAGEHRIAWDGRGDDGRNVPVGVYYGVIRTREGSEQRRMTVIR